MVVGRPPGGTAPTVEEKPVPRLTSEELDGWVREFHALEQAHPSSPQAVDASWDESMVDTALIVVRLETSGTEVFLRREIGGSPEWTVTFEARERDARATADQVLALAHEVGSVARLCAFLTAKTTEHMERLAR
jgi:hypothetical protein